MHSALKLFISLMFILSFQVHASRVDLVFERNGSLGHSITHEDDGVNVTISAHYYDLITNEVFSGVVVGIDGIVNNKHPAGIGVGKSESSINPPGIDNVGGIKINDISHAYLEFLVFSFDRNVTVNAVETDGLGPHGTDANYWGGQTQLENGFDMTALGSTYTAIDSASSFLPSSELDDVSWFAVAAKPADNAFNVFSLQTIQFTASPVPVPAAFWLFITGIIGLISKRKFIK